MTSLAEMLNAFVARVLPDVAFEEGVRYRLALSVEGGLYRLDQAFFAGPFELFGVVFLLEGNGGDRQRQAPPMDLRTSKTTLDAENGLVVDLVANDVAEGSPR